MSGGEQPLRRIAIFGKSHELWPVAALLELELPPDITLVLVEDTRPVEPAAVTVRLDDPLLLRLGINGEDLQKTSSAVFALGCELRDWKDGSSSFFLTGSGSLPAVDDVAIHQIMLRAAELNDQRDRLAYLYQPFRLPARAAAAGKFAFQSPDPRSPLSMLRPTVQIDRAEYAELFRQRTKSRRTEIVKASPKFAFPSSDGGAIDRIALDNGAAIKADFHIDMSGEASGLVTDFPRPDWHSIAGKLPFDRLLSGTQTGVPSAAERHVVARAIRGGLMISTPLRERSTVQLLCLSGHLSADEWRALVGSEAQEIRLDPGYVDQAWTGNMVRLGSASASLGPFLSADTTILHRQAVILANHLPARLDMTVEAREYNRRHLAAVEHVRDFTLLPFALNRRTDLPWSGIEKQRMPENLRRRIDQFRSRGRLVAFEDEIFDEQSWIDLMMGFGIVPDRFDPMAQTLDMAAMPRRLKNLTRAFDRALAEMPL
ncbi:tryptophan 7-halogenase [Sphingorhabdus sp. SMR4y]|uniref:tryptophan 7-halogenase n=1 Tax=Sphingorhabdus sp. SMR4y TaxID=2584094 RepID=UPI000B5C7D2E|nr:tryptophan 7-halogenase [Sphingorhabdus sp. SMR4y]ASK87428.1 flavin-dependent tryptophan halogenase RebH [Sphingorhabdus sp. SMR4y]